MDTTVTLMLLHTGLQIYYCQANHITGITLHRMVHYFTHSFIHSLIDLSFPYTRLCSPNSGIILLIIRKTLVISKTLYIKIVDVNETCILYYVKNVMP
jgi:hypothetical protein